MKKIIAFSALALLIGCAAPQKGVEITWLSLQAARTAQEGMVEPGGTDPNRVYGAKLKIGDQFYSLTTHAPVILASTGYEDEKAVTAIRFSRDQHAIQLFTRNPKNGEGFRAEIPLPVAKDWPVFSFPVIQGRGLDMRAVQVVDLIRKPDLDDNVRGFREYLQREMPPLDPQFHPLPKAKKDAPSADY